MCDPLNCIFVFTMSLRKEFCAARSVNYSCCTVLLIFLVCTISVQTLKSELRIAWMAPEEEYYGISVASSIGAVKTALQAIIYSGQPSVFRNHTIRIRWFNSGCSLKDGLSSAVDAKYMFDPHVFVGPPCAAAMRGVGLLASHWNIPIFSWFSQEGEFRDKTQYSTLVRFLPPFHSFQVIMNQIKAIFNWKIYSIVHDQESRYRDLAETISKSANNISIKSMTVVSPVMTTQVIKNVFQRIKKHSRVIIFVVPWLSMRKYMLVAQELGMTTGEFVFICMNPNVYTHKMMETEVLSDKVWYRNDTDDQSARAAFESVLHVMMGAMDKTRWDKFSEITTVYSNINNENWVLPTNGKKADTYSTYLYEAILTWAIVANRVIKEGISSPFDGEYMFKKCVGYMEEGITGKINIDSEGDRTAVFNILDMSSDGTFSKVFSLTKNGISMHRPSLRWPDGNVGLSKAPPDAPLCGFDNEKC